MSRCTHALSTMIDWVTYIVAIGRGDNLILIELHT